MTRDELLKIAKPILFNTEMVQAIIDGRKTATRRVVKFPKYKNPLWTGYVPDGHTLYGSNNIPAAESHYKAGDILYVRETWQEDEQALGQCNRAYGYIYKADYDYQSLNSCDDSAEEILTDFPWCIKWRPSIHMPKAAARIFLKVTNVRAERLRDITAEDCKKEGIKEWYIGMGESGFSISLHSLSFYGSAIGAFAALWNDTIPKKELEKQGWNANPWVWVIEFERIEVE